MHPVVVFLLDGLADRAHESLGGRSGLEAAKTPNLDRLCASASCGVLYAVGPGRAPSSEVAHWSMFGYRPDEFPGRAVFEALGRGQEVSVDHVFAYAALRPAERRDDGWWLTGRPDPDRDAEETERLVEACDGITIDGLTFSLAHVWRGEAVLRVAGGADDRGTDSDAFFRDRPPRERLNAGDTFVFCHVKSADAAGHTKDPRQKQEMIELLDGALGDLPTDRAIVCLTGDHATPASPDVIHSGDPVPFVVAGPGVRADRVTEFGESTCADGILGHLRGPDMMPVLLNAADRPLFLGSRPTPFDGADGYPSILEPLL